MTGAEVLVMEEQDKECEKNRERRSLAICGYRKWTFNTATKHTEKTTNRNNNEEHRSKGSVTLPYVPGVTENLQLLIRSYRVSAHLKPYNTLRSILVAPKDITKTMDKAGIVYNI
jgi:hypothetical protein